MCEVIQWTELDKYYVEWLGLRSGSVESLASITTANLWLAE
jgi:hypothetical protein